jgi:hypothetical protein
MAGVKTGKVAPKSVPTPPTHAAFIPGSRPDTIRAPYPPRIQPLAQMRDYGKKG